MLEGNITLIAEKLGMTITQVYNLNLEYTRIMVGVSMWCIGIMIIFYIAWNVMVWYATRSDSECFENCMLGGISLGLIPTAIIGMVAYGIFLVIILPSQIPEYFAMQNTLHQLSGII
jgi:hypothetical protein